MGRLVALALLALLVPVFAHAAGPPVTTWQVSTRFRQETGDKLVVNRKSSYPGHYTALDLGAPTIAKKARYGTFTVYVATGVDVEADISDLLADGHTGVVGKPGAGGIYWESGSTMYGDRYWLAKRRYGHNVVSWWIGPTPVKKTDATFRRLHAALTKAVR